MVEGALGCDGHAFEQGALIVLRPEKQVTVRAERPTRLMLLGGAALSGPRHIYWNFVSSSQERIERAKDDWRNGRFGKVPGDEQEFIPLPQDA